MEYLIFELSIVLISSALIGTILYFFKQPLILAYILAGILIGPIGFGLIKDVDFINGISGIGIILMLFLVGLEMSIPRLKDLGFVSIIVGVGQVVLTGVVGFFIMKIFGLTSLQSIYIAIALTFSSTVIAVKLISDKKDIKSLYGQICIGILIVQDIIAIIALLVLAGFKEVSFSLNFFIFANLILKGAILAILSMLISKYVLKHIYDKIATSHELLILFSLSWCFLISILSIEIGFSMEIGAFIAGISLANLPYTFEINSKSKVLRDFFITVFFVALGSGMIFNTIGELIIPIVVLSLFILIGKPIIVLLLMSVIGYDKRTSFLTGLNIANISEFSLIVIALGYKLGHINHEIASMITIIGITTMIISSYMITYDNQLYNIFKNYLFIFNIGKKKNIISKNIKHSNHVILFGCGQVGEELIGQIMTIKDDYVIVDHDNEIIKELIKKKINCIFGNIEDEDLLDSLDIQDAELIICTLPNIEDNYILLKYVDKLEKSKRPIVIMTSNFAREGLELFKRGADYIILKSYLGASHIRSINRELYSITKDEKSIALFGDETSDKKNILKRNMIHSHNEEGKIAKILQGLNKLRLKEIKEKIESKKINLVVKN